MLTKEKIVELISKLSSHEARDALCQAVMNREDREDALVRLRSFITTAFDELENRAIANNCISLLYEAMVKELEIRDQIIPAINVLKNARMIYDQNSGKDD